MKKRVNLADSIKSKVAGKGYTAQASEDDAAQLVEKGKGASSGSRRGKSFIGGYFPPEVAKQLRLLAVENDTTIQSLTGEALNHLFAAYGKGEIAPTKE